MVRHLSSHNAMSALAIDDMVRGTSTAMTASDYTPSLPPCAGLRTDHPVDMVQYEHLSSRTPSCWTQTQTLLTRLPSWQVSPDNCTVDQIAQQIVKLRECGANPIYKFRKPADKDIDQFLFDVDQALLRLDQDRIRRAEYDSKSTEVLLYIMPEPPMHHQVQKSVTDEILFQLKKWANEKNNSNESSVADVARIKRRVGRVRDKGTALIKRNGLPWRCPDLSFGPLGAMPSLVGEVS